MESRCLPALDHIKGFLCENFAVFAVKGAMYSLFSGVGCMYL
jgi:hypothetical protein